VAPFASDVGLQDPVAFLRLKKTKRKVSRLTSKSTNDKVVRWTLFLALASWQIDQKSEKGVFRRGHQKAGTAGFTPHTMIDAARLGVDEIAGI
jgi:hypothetical protein